MKSIFNLNIFLVAGLFSWKSLAAPLTSVTNQWLDIVLFHHLIDTELKELKNIPTDFKKPYEVEIRSKTKSLILLRTMLKVKSGKIKAEGSIPDKFKTNPYDKKFDQSWSLVISKLETLPMLNCESEKKESVCALFPLEDAKDLASSIDQISKESNSGDLIKFAANKNWTESLRLAYDLTESDPFHFLTYEIIQRIYSLKHQGAGEVAIKGI